ncbi:MAG: hypothetical protein QXO71_00740 [Candidatus Jordarchaeaceae archaeon]
MKIKKSWDHKTGEYVTKITEGKRKCTVKVGSTLKVDVADDDALELDYSIDELTIEVDGDKELALQAAGPKGLRAYLDEFLQMKREGVLLYNSFTFPIQKFRLQEETSVEKCFKKEQNETQ